MIEITPLIVIVGIFLCFVLALLFLLSIILTPLCGFLMWYSYNAKESIMTLRENVSEMTAYANLKDNLDHILESLVDLGSVLQEVNEMPAYSNEPVILQMLKEIENTLQEIEGFVFDKDLIDFLEEKENTRNGEE